MPEKLIYYPGIMIFIMYRDKFLLILRDTNNDTISSNTWSPVSGKVESGDTYFETVIKETKEEICLTPKELIPLGTTRRHNALFFSRLTDEEVSLVTLGEEGQAINLFTFEELKDIRIAKAFKDHLENAPEIFRRMSTDGYIPNQKDLFLQDWKDYP